MMNIDALYEYVKTLEGRIETLEGSGNNEAVSDKVDRSGDTMTGNLNINKSSPRITLNNSNTGNDSDTFFYANRTNTDKQLYVGIGAGGNNRGVYAKSQTAGTDGWLLYTNDNNVYLNSAEIGNLYLNGHNTYLGYITSNSGTKALASGATSKALSDEIELTVGTWLLVGRASIPASVTSGALYLAWYNVTNASVVANSPVTKNMVSNSGVFTGLQTVYAVRLTSATKYRLNCYHTAGSEQTITYQWLAVRIC